MNAYATQSSSESLKAVQAVYGGGGPNMKILHPQLQQKTSNSSIHPANAKKVTKKKTSKEHLFGGQGIMVMSDQNISFQDNRKVTVNSLYT